MGALAQRIDSHPGPQAARAARGGGSLGHRPRPLLSPIGPIPPPPAWLAGRRLLPSDQRTLVMGILNVTPDSFSDGGVFLETDRAVEHGLRMVNEGADLVDVGGQSTRPGSQPVTVEEEVARVVPVVGELAARGVVVSIDTSRSVVAAAALAAGASVVNDITALGDPEMAGLVSGADAGLVLMHMQGTPATMQIEPRYDDVVSEVRDFLIERAARAREAGVAAERICIDPGIGFGKTLDHNLDLLRHLDALTAAGYPVLVGTSRKAFIGTLLGGAPAAERVEGTGATLALAVASGAAAVRVHDVAAAVRVCRVADAIVRGTP